MDLNPTFGTQEFLETLSRGGSNSAGHRSPDNSSVAPSRSSVNSSSRSPSNGNTQNNNSAGSAGSSSGNARERRRQLRREARRLRQQEQEQHEQTHQQYQQLSSQHFAQHQQSSHVDEAYRRLGQRLSLQAHGDVIPLRQLPYIPIEIVPNRSCFQVYDSNSSASDNRTTPSSSSTSSAAVIAPGAAQAGAAVAGGGGDNSSGAASSDRTSPGGNNNVAGRKHASSNSSGSGGAAGGREYGSGDTSSSNVSRTQKVAKTRYSDHGDHHTHHASRRRGRIRSRAGATSDGYKNLLRALTFEAKHSFKQWEEQHLLELKQQKPANPDVSMPDASRGASASTANGASLSPQQYAFSKLTLDQQQQKLPATQQQQQQLTMQMQPPSPQMQQQQQFQSPQMQQQYSGDLLGGVGVVSWGAGGQQRQPGYNHRRGASGGGGGGVGLVGLHHQSKGLLSAVLEGHSDSATSASGTRGNGGGTVGTGYSRTQRDRDDSPGSQSISTKDTKDSLGFSAASRGGNGYGGNGNGNGGGSVSQATTSASGSTTVASSVVAPVRGKCLTVPNVAVANEGLDNAEGNLIVYENDAIHVARKSIHTFQKRNSAMLATRGKSKSTEFRVQSLLGQGTFAQVFQCLHVASGKLVAVKVVKNKPAYTRQATVEIDVFRALQEQEKAAAATAAAAGIRPPSASSTAATAATMPTDSSGAGTEGDAAATAPTANATAGDASDSNQKDYMVNLICYFMHRSHLCLVFELLGLNLYEVLKRRQFRGLPLTMVRSIVARSVEGVKELSQKGIVHCDLKPENVLFVSDQVGLSVVRTGELITPSSSSAGNTMLPRYDGSLVSGGSAGGSSGKGTREESGRSSKETDGGSSKRTDGESSGKRTEGESSGKPSDGGSSGKSKPSESSRMTAGGSSGKATQGSSNASPGGGGSSGSSSMAVTIQMGNSMPSIRPIRADCSIKLIDFGSACFEGYTAHTYIQSRFYRSPEVLVGLPYDSAIDMWSLGCVAAELFLGLPILPGVHEHDQLGRVAEMIAKLPDWMLEQGTKASKYFVKFVARTPTVTPFSDASGSPAPPAPQWRLKTKQEYISSLSQNDIKKKGGLAKLEKQPGTRYFQRTRLPDILALHGQNTQGEDKELLPAFIHFLYGMLDPDPWKRWTAFQALQHPFVTGHLKQLRRKTPDIKMDSKEANQANLDLEHYWQPPWDPAFCRRKLLNVQKTREKQQAMRRNLSSRASPSQLGGSRQSRSSTIGNESQPHPAYGGAVGQMLANARPTDSSMGSSPPTQVATSASTNTTQLSTAIGTRGGNSTVTSATGGPLMQMISDSQSKLSGGQRTSNSDGTATGGPQERVISSTQSFAGISYETGRTPTEGDFGIALQRPGVVPGRNPESYTSVGSQYMSMTSSHGYGQQPAFGQMTSSFPQASTTPLPQGSYVTTPTSTGQGVSMLDPQAQLQQQLLQQQQQLVTGQYNNGAVIPGAAGFVGRQYGAATVASSAASSVTMGDGTPFGQQQQRQLQQGIANLDLQTQLALLQQQQQLAMLQQQQLAMQQHQPVMMAQPGGGSGYYYVTDPTTGQPVLLQPVGLMNQQQQMISPQSMQQQMMSPQQQMATPQQPLMSPQVVQQQPDQISGVETVGQVQQPQQILAQPQQPQQMLSPQLAQQPQMMGLPQQHQPQMIGLPPQQQPQMIGFPQQQQPPQMMIGYQQPQVMALPQQQILQQQSQQQQQQQQPSQRQSHRRGPGRGTSM